MAEDRSCLTCSHYLIDGCGDTKGCASLTGWQPIQKAPSFQITEEEARKILEVATILRVRGDMEIWIGNLKHAGYIRKSALVELVEEAEELWSACYRNTELEPSNLNAKLYQALQALKKIIKSSEVRNDHGKRKV
jgi:hypothetical protein